MCGIAGHFGRFDESLLASMAKVIAHRGPDGNGTWRSSDNGLGLAHRRLAIIDLSPAGHQPMMDPDGKAIIVFNGEIYNYKDLRVKLEAQGVKFRGNSDTEVLLNLYLVHGLSMLPMLNGIFAFAIWDCSKKELVLARDQLGVKPLYISEDTRGILFSSEIKAILQDSRVSREIDTRAVRDHLTYVYAPAPRTMLTAVKKVLPGESIIIRDGKITSRNRWYRLPYHQDLLHLSFEEAAYEVSEAVKKAVERQMVSDVPVGAFLSGGLDSSAVVAFAQHYSRAGVKLPCFTIKDNTHGSDGFSDDLPYAKKVAKHLGSELNVIDIDSSIAHRLKETIWHLDEPLADPAAINTLLICEAARDRGIKVLLSGAGGDDLFTGYRRHYALSKENIWSWLPQPMRVLIRSTSQLLPKKNANFRRLSKAFAYADLPSNDRLLSYFRWLNEDNVNGLLAPDIRSKLTSDSFCASLASTLEEAPDNIDPLNKMLFLEKSHFLPDHNLNYGDKMSMAAGVECRVPLVDPELVSLAAKLPVSYKQRGNIGKAVFKKAMEPHLPMDAVYRPKSGFGADLRHWINHDLSELMEDTMSPEALRNRGLFDVNGVRTLIDADRSGLTDASYSIFSMACIEIWCRQFIDSMPAKY